MKQNIVSTGITNYNNCTAEAKIDASDDKNAGHFESNIKYENKFRVKVLMAIRRKLL